MGTCNPGYMALQSTYVHVLKSTHVHIMYMYVCLCQVVAKIIEVL